MHFKPVFIFTLEDDCNKNWIFCFPSAFRLLKTKIFSIFILSFFTQNCTIFLFYIVDIGQIVDIYLSFKMALKAVGDENWPKFFKANFNPLKLKFFKFFLAHHGQI